MAQRRTWHPWSLQDTKKFERAKELLQKDKEIKAAKKVSTAHSSMLDLNTELDAVEALLQKLAPPLSLGSKRCSVAGWLWLAGCSPPIRSKQPAQLVSIYEPPPVEAQEAAEEAGGTAPQSAVPASLSVSSEVLKELQ